MTTYDFEALATALCHPRVGRISWTCVSSSFQRGTRVWLPERWEASAWIRSPWLPLEAPTMLELLHLIHEHLGRPSYPREAIELDQARDAVERFLCAPERAFTEVERYGGEWPAQHLPGRFRVGLSSSTYIGWCTWCNGDTPAQAFLCAAAVVRGDLRPSSPRGEAELPAPRPKVGPSAGTQHLFNFTGA